VQGLLKTATREGTNLQIGTDGGTVKDKKGKRFPGFCQMASVVGLQEAEASVKNIILDSFFFDGITV
jgi:hypothetical protein